MIKELKRNCPICNNSEGEILHKQEFVLDNNNIGYLINVANPYSFELNKENKPHSHLTQFGQKLLYLLKFHQTFLV